MSDPSRRQFLRHTSSALAGAGLFTSFSGDAMAFTQSAGAAAERFPRPTKDAISLAIYSLNRSFTAGLWTLNDIARIAREDFNVDGIEYVTIYFKDVREQAALRGLNQRAADHGVQNVLIMVDQEGGDPGSGAVVGGEPLGVADVPAHEAEQVRLQARQARREHRDPREREAAELHLVERDRVAGVALAVDRGQADDLPGQVEGEDLLTPLAVDARGLHGAAADGGDGVEAVARAEDVRTGLERPDVLDQHVELPQRSLVEALREAGRGKSAGRAEADLVAVVRDDGARAGGEDRPGRDRSHAAMLLMHPRPGEHPQPRRDRVSCAAAAGR